MLKVLTLSLVYMVLDIQVVFPYPVQSLLSVVGCPLDLRRLVLLSFNITWESTPLKLMYSLTWQKMGRSIYFPGSARHSETTTGIRCMAGWCIGTMISTWSYMFQSQRASIPIQPKADWFIQVHVTNNPE